MVEAPWAGSRTSPQWGGDDMKLRGGGPQGSGSVERE